MLGLGLQLGIRRRNVKSVRSRATALWLAREYDATLDALVDQSGNGLHARFGSAVGADTNDPLRLTYSGEKYVYLPGVAGNYISTPDAAFGTTELELVGRVAPTDWTPATLQAVVAKDDNGTNRSAYLGVAGGGLFLAISQDGAAVTTATSSVAPAFADGAVGWCKATWRASDGRVQFFTAADQASEPQTWTQLGTDRTIALASIFNGTALVEVGSRAGGTATPFVGRVLRAIVRNTIGGAASFDFDASLCGQSGYTDPNLGTVWTVHRSSSGVKACVVDGSVPALLLLGSNKYLEVADDSRLDFAAGDSLTAVAVIRQHGAHASTRAYIAKKLSAATADVGWAIFTDNSGGSFPPRANIGDGAVGALANIPSLVGGNLYSLAAVRNTATDLVTGYRGATAGPEPTDSTTGTLANTSPLYVGRVDTVYADFEFVAAAIFREALSADDLARLAAELGVAA